MYNITMAKLTYNQEEADQLTGAVLSRLTYKKDYYQDLLQTGRIAYCEAMRDFKHNKKTKFTSFAWMVIKRKLITHINTFYYPCNNWILAGDIRTVFANGEEQKDDYKHYQRTVLPAVYNFTKEDEKDMLENMKKLFFKNWSLDYEQYRALRKETLEKYWVLILDRYNGLSMSEICKKNNIDYKSLDNILQRIFTCMRRKPKFSELVKQNKNKPKKKKRKKAKKKKTYDAEYYLKYNKKKNYRGLPEFI